MAAFFAPHSDNYSLYSVHNPPAAIANCMSDKNSMSAFPAFTADSKAERHNVSDIAALNTGLVSSFDVEKGHGSIKECPSNFDQANATIHLCDGSSPSADLEKKRNPSEICQETDDHCTLKTCDQKDSLQRAAKVKHRRSSECDQHKSYRKDDKDCDNKKAKADSADGLIFVRAKRGQATDKHSLAERVRREKINERMRFLQSLVPGCCKATAKAVILDEIINYVKSLQNQVDFLSMKLSAASRPYDFSLQMENYMAKDELVPVTECQNAPDRYSYIVDISQPSQYRTAIDDSLTNMTWSTFIGEPSAGFMGTDQGNGDLQSLVQGGFPAQNRIH